ncbi:MAG: helix-turn-helix domain-containing protein [Chloroflexi bacterium]|nr:helix-turn-helix domain-containing protein [Chloroflexota bacterium]
MSLGAARSILSVSEATLRRWADHGVVRTFRTPGGHRRFSQSDVRALAENSVRLSTERAPLGLDEAALRRIRRRLRSIHGVSEGWYRDIGEAHRQWLREMGRQLLGLIVLYLGEQRRRAELAAEVRVLGEKYGALMAQGDLPLHQVVSAFLFFRNAVTDATREALPRASMTVEELLQIWRQVVRLTDRVLLAAVEAYGAARNRGT